MIKSYKLQSISCFQIFSLFFVSRVLVSLTYIPSLSYQQAKGDLLLEILMMLPLLLLFFMPVYFYMKQYGNQNLADVAHQYSKPAGVGVSLLYFLWFVFTAALNINRFVYFVTSEMSENASSLLLILLLTVAAGYGAYLGIQSIGRVAAVVLWMLLVSFAFIMLFALKHFSFTNFAPILEVGLSANIKSAISLACHSAELSVLPFILPTMCQPVRKKHILTWASGLVALVFCLYFVTIGTLGDFAKTQSFPVYAMSQISGVGILQRMDAVHTSIWIIALFLKTAMFLIAACVALRGVFPKLKMPWSIVVGGGLTASAAFVMSLTFPNFFKVSNRWFDICTFLIFAVVIPGIFVLLAKKRKGRVYETAVQKG